MIIVSAWEREPHGMYDVSIWASLHDVVRPERRATAVGVMNSIG